MQGVCRKQFCLFGAFIQTTNVRGWTIESSNHRQSGFINICVHVRKCAFSSTEGLTLKSNACKNLEKWDSNV